MDLMYPMAGGLTGFVVGLTGVGGGALMTPILLLIFGVAPTTAVATDLWFATFTKIAAIFIHQREQQVDWTVVRRLWTGSLPGAGIVILALWMGWLAHLNSKFLTSTIGVAILITAIGLYAKRWLTPGSVKTHPNRHRLQGPITILSGLILGVLVAFTSVGAGALGSIVLLYLYPEITPKTLVGSDIAHAIPLALIAGLGYLAAEQVNFNILAHLLLGSIPAAVLGSIMATRFSHNKLRFFLVTVLSISGVKLIV